MLTIESLDARQDRIAVVGLGYVGLPLAVHLAHYEFRLRRLSSDMLFSYQATDAQHQGSVN